MRTRFPLRLASKSPVYLLIILILSLIAGLVKFSGSHKVLSESEDAVVQYVVDGDTLRLSDRRKVRLIGIDTPEVHESNKLLRDVQRSGQDIETIRSAGRKAWAFTRKLVEGKRVRLEFDVETSDRYGRLLAYIYLEDGTFVNAKIVENGYASLMTMPPNVKHADEFRELFVQARKAQRGLWQEDSSGGRKMGAVFPGVKTGAHQE